MAEQRIIARIALETFAALLASLRSPKRDGPGRARALTGGDDFAVGDRAILLFGGAPGPADALDAIGAFFHHAALPDRDFRIVLRLDRLGAEVGVFLTVRVAEEIEAADLVGAIRFAEARADAAIVNLHIQALAVMHRSSDGTNRLARRIFAMHARHGLKARVFGLSGVP